MLGVVVNVVTVAQIAGPNEMANWFLQKFG